MTVGMHGAKAERKGKEEMLRKGEENIYAKERRREYFLFSRALF